MIDNYNADRIKNLVLDKIHKENKTNVDINDDSNTRLNLSMKRKNSTLNSGNIGKVNMILKIAACFVLLSGALISLKFLTPSVQVTDSIESSIEEQSSTKTEENTILNSNNSNDNSTSVVADTDESSAEEVPNNDDVLNNDEVPNTDEVDENAIYPGSTLLYKEIQLAKDLFDFDYINANIYLPFYSISCKAQYSNKPDTLTLWFDYGVEDTLPNFDNTNVYLYDLSIEQEVVSSVIGYQISNYQYVGSDELRHTGTLDLDPSNLVINHAYYIRIDYVEANESEINNIVCLFSYDTGRSIDVRNQVVVKDADYIDLRMATTDSVTTENKVNNEGNANIVSNEITDMQISYEIEDKYEYRILPPEEYTLAHELFNYDYNQTIIYTPLYSVSCMLEFNGNPESFTLWFDFGSNDVLPNFDNAEVVLYDLTSNEEVSTKILDYRINGYQYVGKEEQRHTGELDIDPSKMVSDHRYYICINNVNADETQIENIQFICAFIPGATFRY